MNWFKYSQKSKGYNSYSFLKEITDRSSENNLNIKTIGKIGTYPILLLTPSVFYPDKKNILICGGFHGDEPSGSLGIGMFLKYKYLKYKDVANLSFLPLVNPTGFEKGTRENIKGEFPNRGYIHTKKLPEAQSTEDKILMKQISTFIKLSKDGCISLHEDIDKKTFYMYSYEKSKKPTNRTLRLLHKGESFFDKADEEHVPNTYLKTNLKYENKMNGLAYNDCDGTFEDLLFHNGSEFCVVTETPGKRDIKIRNKVNMELICEFIDIIVKK